LDRNAMERGFKATIEQLKEWSRWPGAGIGLQARNLLALDIDVNDATVADQIETLAQDYLGFAPVRLRNGSPRRLLVYRRAKGQPPIRKMRLTWRDTSGVKHAVEALGAGQYWNAEGIHPSGARYVWRNNESPVEWGADNLTAIDDAVLRRFFNGAA
jgi:bifunctional DNA primase/polymerase-like protein